MDILSAVILGVVEGVTEFLPISSTAHLLLVERLLGSTTDSIAVVIQAGAILAVVALYLSQWRRIVRLLPVLAIALVPTVVLGVLAYPLIKGIFAESVLLIAVALLVGGVVMLWSERYFDHRTDESMVSIDTLHYRHAIIIGLLQCVAFIPGVSRSLATLLAGQYVGLSRRDAVEFSFLLSVPTILMAAGYDVLKNPQLVSSDHNIPLLVGLLVSFVVALVVIRWLLRYVQTHSLRIFAWYRIVFGLVLLGIVCSWFVL